MKSSKNAILIVTLGMVVFIALCNSKLNVPTGFLIGFLLALHAGLIWMIITILRHGKPGRPLHH